MVLLDLFDRLRDRVVQRRRERARHELARRLAATSTPSYTEDYVGRHAENWARWLGPWAGRRVRMLEIGSYEGRSTVWFLENILSHPDAEITCIDIFSEAYWELRFDHNIKICGRSHQVKKLKGKSEELLPGLPEASFDIIYVDGSHAASDVLLDGFLSWKLLVPGGLLLFDDYEWDPEKKPSERPQMAIDLLLEALAGRFELVHQGYQVAIRKHP